MLKIRAVIERFRTHLALAALMSGAACPEPDVCTLSGCASEPWIRVVDEGITGGHLRAGKYVFRLQSADMTLEWECVLAADDAPDPACDRSSLTAMGESKDGPVRWVVDVVHEGDGLAIELVEIREEGKIITGPEQLTITVMRDDLVQIEETHDPEYTGNWPNGMECGPYCAAASEPVVVRVPE